MAAVLAPVPSHRPTPTRPTLRALPGGRSAAPARPLPAPATTRRRRLAAAALALAVVLAAALAATSAWSALTATTVTTTAPGGAAPAAAPTPPSPAEVHVVQPGDTLWAIAASLGTGGDLRSVVDELAERAGGAQLRPGQRIDLRGLGA